jgi:nucleotide-binding universal stress UspA family protein
MLYITFIIINKHETTGCKLLIKKILVPFDNSKYSERSLAYAVNLANVVFLGNRNKLPVKILLLHVIQELPITRSLLDKPLRNKNSGSVTTLSDHALDIYKQMEDSMQKAMQEKIDKIRSVDGVSFERIIIYGNPANEIVDYAKKNKVDLLIMGSNGLEGLAKIKGWGSVSRKVSERVSCPITIIR